MIALALSLVMASAGGVSLPEVLGSVASLGVVALLGRSLGSGTLLFAGSVLPLEGSLFSAALLAGVVGVAARGSNLSGTLTAAGGCGLLSEALGTRIGTAWIGSKATLSWLLDCRLTQKAAPPAISAMQTVSTRMSLKAMSLTRIHPSARVYLFGV